MELKFNISDGVIHIHQKEMDTLDYERIPSISIDRSDLTSRRLIERNIHPGQIVGIINEKEDTLEETHAFIVGVVEIEGSMRVVLVSTDDSQDQRIAINNYVDKGSFKIRKSGEVEIDETFKQFYPIQPNHILNYIQPTNSQELVINSI